MVSSLHDWTPDRLAYQDNKTFVITGGNSGIGFEAARLLVGCGARVLLACRSADKAETAIDVLKTSAKGDGRAEAIQLDLASLTSVRAAAEEIKDKAPHIHALINNAGIMAPPQRQITKDGFEAQFGTNHLGHFLLSALLADHVRAADGRIVAVSSTMHKAGLKRIRFEDLNWETKYAATAAYSQSKLANALFILELNTRLEAAGLKPFGYICHPGYAATALQTKETKGFVRSFMAFGNIVSAQSATRGSWPTVLAAADIDAVPGRYYGPTGFFELRGPVGECKLAHQAKDIDAANKLWTLSEEAVGHRWDI